MSAVPQPATRRGHEFAVNAETALREGKVEEAKMWHKNAWNAFKEARDGLMEGDSNTKMALKILIDYHREKEKNPGDVKYIHSKVTPLQQPNSLPQPTPIIRSTSSSTSSLPDAWAAVQEFGELIHGSTTPSPLPEFLPSSKIANTSVSDWKKGNQSILMAESYLLVGGDNGPLASNQNQLGKSTGISSPDRSNNPTRALTLEVERLTKDLNQMKNLITKEREDAKLQSEKFWKMFVLVKATLEETNHESDLKALTRLLHVETEARKKAEADLAAVRRSYS